MIRIGCSGWSYDHWIGILYPFGAEKKDYFNIYSKKFDTVEINSTFYRLPFPSFVAGWVKKAPKNFVYAVKVNKKVSHVKKLKGTGEDLSKFLSAIKPLKENGLLGPLLIQLPPSLKLNVKLLENFLSSLETGKYRYVLEFRHRSWFTHETYTCLEKYNVGFCIISCPRLPEEIRVTSNFSYIRFHGKHSWYNYNYTDVELRKWAEKIGEISETGARDIYIYFNNDFNGYAVKNAEKLKEILSLHE